MTHKCDYRTYVCVCHGEYTDIMRHTSRYGQGNKLLHLIEPWEAYLLFRDRGPLLGRCILTSNGPYWAHQRKIVAPEFYLDKVKGMVNMMAESTSMCYKAGRLKLGIW